MTVGELIAALEDYDEDATVLLMSQPSWPFEYSVVRVLSREEIPLGEDDYEYDEDGEPRGPAEPKYGTSCNGNDVFLVEGSQLRYGNKNAWEA